jgi:carbamoyl-phosphate synthase large subunit
LAKAQEATGATLPAGGAVFVSVANRDKRSIVLPASRLAQMGFRILATRGTASVLARAGVPVRSVPKRSEGGPNATDLIAAGEIQLVINTPFGREPRTDGYFIRTEAARAGVPCITTIQGVIAALQGIEAVARDRDEPRPLQALHATAPGGAPGGPRASWVPDGPVVIVPTLDRAPDPTLLASAGGTEGGAT